MATFVQKQATSLNQTSLPVSREQVEPTVPTASEADLAALDSTVTTLSTTRAKGRFVYG